MAVTYLEAAASEAVTLVGATERRRAGEAAEVEATVVAEGSEVERAPVESRRTAGCCSGCRYWKGKRKRRHQRILQMRPEWSRPRPRQWKG